MVIFTSPGRKIIPDHLLHIVNTVEFFCGPHVAVSLLIIGSHDNEIEVILR
jgi:hypothetical protein